MEAAKLANADEFIVAHAARIRHAGGRTRRYAFRRPAAAHRDCARVIRNNPILILDEPTAALDTRIGKAGDRGAGAADEGPNGDHDRAPAEHHSRCGQDHRAERRSGGGARARTTSCWRSMAFTRSCIEYNSTATPTSRGNDSQDHCCHVLRAACDQPGCKSCREIACPVP